MIIVEGPDGSGKTTLINELSEELKIQIAPRVVSKDTEAMVDLKRWTEANVKEGFQSVLFDRHRLISEPIYGPILRDRPEPGFGELEWFHDMTVRFYSCRPLIIYCLPPAEVVGKNLFSDPNNTAIFHRWEQIYSAYVARISHDYTFYRGTLVWDYTIGIHRDQIFDRVKKTLYNKGV